MKFPVAGEDPGRDSDHEDAAQGAANRDHQVERSQIALRRLQPDQLAVTDHADGEEQRQVADNLNYDAGIGAAENDQRRKRRDTQGRMEDVTTVPALIIKTDDE